MLRIAICDDNELDRRRLITQIEAKKQECEIQLQEFSSGEELLKASGIFIR